MQTARNRRMWACAQRHVTSAVRSFQWYTVARASINKTRTHQRQEHHKCNYTNVDCGTGIHIQINETCQRPDGASKADTTATRTRSTKATTIQTPKVTKTFPRMSHQEVFGESICTVFHKYSVCDCPIACQDCVGCQKSGRMGRSNPIAAGSR